MSDTAVAFTTVLVAGIIIFFAVLLSTLMGMLSGWIVGLFFTSLFHEVMIALGLQPIALWKFGAFLGFVGAFFRSTHNTNNK